MSDGTENEGAVQSRQPDGADGQPDEARLQSDKSPSMVEPPKKKRARRINNIPLFVTLLVVSVIIGVLALVVAARSNQPEWMGAESGGGGTATNMVNDLVTPGGGIIGAAMPPVLPGPVAAPAPVAVAAAGPTDGQERPDVPVIAEPAPAPTLTQTAPQAPDPDAEEWRQERRRLRQRKMQMTEAAVMGALSLNISGEATRQAAAENTRNALEAEIQRTQMQIDALGRQDRGQSYAERLAAVRAATESSMGIEVNEVERGDLSRMQRFAGDESRWSGRTDLQAPPSMFILRTGSVIPATLISGINSDLPGQIIGQVAQDVYDTPTGKHVIIPQGSRLVGEYSSEIMYGQSRVFAVWQRIIYPDGKALDLGAMPAATGDGYAGLRDRVNNHYIRIFGSALMMSMILAGVEMTQNNDSNNSNNNNGGYNNGGNTNNQTRMSDALSESLGQTFGGMMAQMMEKNLNIAPTLEVRPGFRLNVMVVKDLVFQHEYRSFDYAAYRR